MWFVRGLLGFAVAAVLLQCHCSYGLTTPDNHFKIMASDSLNAFWAQIINNSVALTKYFLVDSVSEEDTDFAKLLTDEDFDKIVTALSTIFPADKQQIETGRGLDKALNIITVIVDYISIMWRQVKSSMWDRMDSFMEWKTVLEDWYASPLDYLFKFLLKPTRRRARSINAVFDTVNKIWLIPTRKLFAAIVNIQADMLAKLMKVSKGSKSAGTQRSMVVAGLYQFKEDFMKFSGHLSGTSKTLYGQKHHMILAKLSGREFSLLNEVVNLMTFAIWSGTGFLMVYKEIAAECYNNRDEIPYTLIEGENYVDDSYLHAVMDNANAKREEACRYYKSQMGENAKEGYSFIAQQFGELMKTTYEQLEPIPTDAVIVDAIAQSLLGRAQPECVLYTLCMAGVSKASEPNPHPGVDLLLGILVSGRTNFGGLLKDGLVMKLGTPKMAEAIYRGFQNECDVYQPPTNVDCANIDMFLMDFEAQPVERA